ncbi:hypothetical protein DWU98_12920 [Dyella monticola]|uniref:DNA-binding protein n=1 Tax=Dyella monticola TaxID=1927958 RepID=A0A370WXI5_9GAMM|nr:hypothetical protein [Dyella monticola]RDS80844.1 hypothetical protein DWU98_12920 [Dyella monticola]
MKLMKDHSAPYCKLKDAANYIGVRPLKLCDMIRKGEIEAHQSPHGETFILWSEIHCYMTRRAGGNV